MKIKDINQMLNNLRENLLNLIKRETAAKLNNRNLYD